MRKLIPIIKYNNPNVFLFFLRDSLQYSLTAHSTPIEMDL